MAKSIYKSELGKKEIFNQYAEILKQWPVTNKQYKIKTNYGNTFVIESGSRENPPLILIHGSVSNSYCWLGDIEALSKSHNVYAIDIIGEAGFSDENRPSYESGIYPEWLKEVTRELHLEKVSIVGLSLGGWMALSYATKYPDEVSNLVLLCPGGLYTQKVSFIFKAVFYSLFGKWGSDQVMKLINGGIAPDKTDEGLRKALDFTSLISKNFNPRMDKLPIFSENELKQLSMPTLAIYGDTDHLLNAEKSIEHLENSTPNVQCVLLKETGHVVTNQASRIVSFLKDGKSFVDIKR